MVRERAAAGALQVGLSYCALRAMVTGFRQAARAKERVEFKELLGLLGGDFTHGKGCFCQKDPFRDMVTRGQTVDPFVGPMSPLAGPKERVTRGSTT